MTTEFDLAPPADLGAGITQIRLPMTSNPLRYVNGYLIADDDGYTLVDCGWRAPDVFEVLRAALAAHGLTPGDLRRVLITHHHFDHYGLAASLRRAGVPELHMHRLDWERARRYVERRAELDARSDRWLERNGYAATGEASPGHDRSELAEPTHFAEDGRPIGRLTPLWTPGHAPGHLCFFDARSGRMLTGDHVLDPITPHIGFWHDHDGDPMGDYLASLEKVASYGANGALPAHGEPFPDLAGRAAEIAAHTHRREDLMLAVLDRGPASAGDVARAIPWTRRERPFGGMSAFHQEFAVSETIAHLEHLRRRERVDRTLTAGVLQYRRAVRGSDRAAV